MSTEVRDTFMFLTKLAWNCKITLPVLITTVFMALNFRWEVEINIHTERIVFQDVDNSNDDGDESDNSWETLADSEDESDIDDILELGRSGGFVTSV
jgi:hypothetical protein